MAYMMGEVKLFGLKSIDKKIDNIIHTLNLNQLNFTLKLIMMEAVTNAYIHGNNMDANKPIFLYYELNDDFLVITVKDCGQGFEDISIPKQISEDDIWNEGGRGLFLINSYADEVEFNNTSITMKKYLSKECKHNEVIHEIKADVSF
jgi:Anti-sigma regulatory factor (Ser/Thr protein kinase)